MIQLACLSRSYCLLQSSTLTTAVRVNICRSIGFRQTSEKGSASRLLLSPKTAVQYVPKRCLQKEKQLKSKHKTDNVPESFTLIYSSNMAFRLIGIFYGVGTMAAFCLTSLTVFAARIMETDLSESVQIPMTTWEISLQIGLPLLYVCAVLIVPLSFHCNHVFKRIVRLYYNKETKQFIGIMKNNFRKKRIEFTLKDVEPVLQTSKLDNIIIKGKSYATFASDFLNPKYANLVMRY